MRATVFVAFAMLWTSMAQCEDSLPTRNDFILEVLNPKLSLLTPKFHDSPKGYHVLKEDLARGLFETAEMRKLDLRGVVIAGPASLDPLWTYTIVAFIREGDKVRVNFLVFPHARITYKSTGLVPVARYEKWVAEMQGTGVMEPKLPAAARGERDEGRRDRMYTLLQATSGPGGKDRRTYYSDPEKLEDEERERFLDALNSIFENQNQTYSVYGEEPEGDKRP